MGAKHAVDPTRLIESTKMAFGDDFEDFYGSILPVPEPQVETPGDGATISIDGRELQVIYAPGHAPHHIAIFDRKTKGLFSGEALGLPQPGAESSPFPVAAPPSFDIEVYLETMKNSVPGLFSIPMTG
jgi:glyoxylase-like metal-dependent hydrolase (beta-lactamase superfamily II)